MKTIFLPSTYAFTAIFAALHGVASAQRADIAEFYNTTLNHYFITSDASEAAMIESGGAGPGWSRTVGAFTIARSTSSNPAAKPVCRFYAAGANSHFFTADAGECAYLKTLEISQRAATPSGQTFKGWAYEGVGFYAQTVNSATGACDAGTTPVYRFYNNRAAQSDSNHRFVVEGHARAEMMKKGWQDEGVAFCGERALVADVAASATIACGPTFLGTAQLRYAVVEEDLAKQTTQSREIVLKKAQAQVFNNQNVLAVKIESSASSGLTETFYFDPFDQGMRMVGKGLSAPADFSDTVYYAPEAALTSKWALGQSASFKSTGRGRFIDEIRPSNSISYTTTITGSRQFLGQAPVVTPAGAFSNACKFTETGSERSNDGGDEIDLTRIFWIVPGVGLVREDSSASILVPNGPPAKSRTTRELLEIK